MKGSCAYSKSRGAPEHYASRRLSLKPVKTWPLVLQSCINPRASQGVKLHKWNLLFDLSCCGNDRNSDKVIFRKYHGRGGLFFFFLTTFSFFPNISQWVYITCILKNIKIIYYIPTIHTNHLISLKKSVFVFKIRSGQLESKILADWEENQ